MAAARTPDLTAATIAAFGVVTLLTLPIGFVACALRLGWL